MKLEPALDTRDRPDRVFHRLHTPRWGENVIQYTRTIQSDYINMNKK